MTQSVRAPARPAVREEWVFTTGEWMLTTLRATHYTPSSR